MKKNYKSWNPAHHQKLLNLLNELEKYPADQSLAALDAHLYVKGMRFLRGVRQYHAHPYQRLQKDQPCIWENGSSRLLHYPAQNTQRRKAPLFLIIPSLINKAYIFDLKESQSFVRFFAQHGIESYLMDWGTPSALEQYFHIEDYILKRLIPALSHIYQQEERPVHILGYCMGAPLALALTQFCPSQIASLSLLAPPWDFHSPDTPFRPLIKQLHPTFTEILKQKQLLEIDLIQSLFNLLDPFGVHEKFERFADLDQTSLEAENFVALEDWLNDGVPLTQGVAIDCLNDWYLNNLTALEQWKIAGKTISARKINHPCHIFIAKNDRIVGNLSSRSLSEQISGAQTHLIDSGHIGMMIGKSAHKTLYEPLLNWLKRLP